MQVMQMHPPGQQVRLSATQLSGARTGQQEAKPAGLLIDDGLHHVQEGGDALHFVDQHGSDLRAGGAQLEFQPFGLRNVVPESGRTGKVDGQVRLERGQQGGLPHLPGAEE